ncbi:MAG: hypothetical protein K2I69_09985 [Muribaculaceae bacterium]|nr:hypothetical protein [Muribaculaceae bacterium]MDE6575338.1 hypothetical protein [Muribaculaceae bacterium]
MKQWFSRLKNFLSGLSFRTGIIVAGVCAMCYILSFAQLLLPFPAVVKGVLWAVLYGMAKASQYTAIIILGKTGVQRIKSLLSRN